MLPFYIANETDSPLVSAASDTTPSIIGSCLTRTPQPQLGQQRISMWQCLGIECHLHVDRAFHCKFSIYGAFYSTNKENNLIIID